MPATKKLKKATEHDLAVIRGFAQRVKDQAQIEADRLDPDRRAARFEVDGDEADLARSLDKLTRVASDVIYAVQYMEKR
jgi:hypothetical protein